MAKQKKELTSSVEDTAAAENVAADVSEKKDNMSKANETEKKTLKKKKVEIDDSEEIEVESLIPNVSYKDNKTGDFYQWDSVGDIEYMTFAVLKDMWRNNKGYFRDFWLKPNDDRVIEKFGLKSLFNQYEFLMEGSSYNKKNVEKVYKSINEISNEKMKYVVCNKVKDLIVSEKLTDTTIIKKLEQLLGIELMVFV